MAETVLGSTDEVCAWAEEHSNIVAALLTVGIVRKNPQPRIHRVVSAVTDVDDAPAGVIVTETASLESA